MSDSTSVFSPRARWEVPPISERQTQPGMNEWFAFRGHLTISGPWEVPVCLRIAADSKYWLYVNGTLVVREGGLKRGPVPDGAYYDEVEIGRFLCVGENTIALLLWYFGRHGFSHRDSGTPGLLVDADFGEFGPWKVIRHPAFFDAGYVGDAYRLSENSVGFDARDGMAAWTEPGFDDSGWARAEAMGPAGSAPWGPLEKREFPQWFCSDLKEYECVDECVLADANGVRQIHCLLPHNAQFAPALEVDAEPGLRIDIHPALHTNLLRASYITGFGRQSFESIGWMSGDAVIYTMPLAGIRVISLRYRETGFPAEFQGTFRCDHEGLNRLWEKAKRTLYVTMRDTFMDCPCRERAQWPGDMVVQLGQAPYCLGREADLLVKKGVREMFRWQRENGILYGPVPEGNWRMELPSQMLAVVSPYGAWTYYMNTGDRETLAEIYPAAKRYLDIWKFQENGLIIYRPAQKGEEPVIIDGVEEGTWDWIDWGKRIDAEPALNAWYVLAAQGVRLMAEELGYTEDAEAVGRREELVRSAIRDAYWNQTRGGFVSPDFEFDPDDRVQALAVLCGAAQPGDFSCLTEILETVEQACPYMEKYVAEALFAMGETDAALERMERRYRRMVQEPGSTLSEQWPHQSDQTGTLNHSWSGGPLTLLSSVVAGIRPAEPGWRRIAVQPRLGKLESVRCSLVIPQGPVQMDAELAGSEWKIRVTIPESTVASVDLSWFDSSLKPVNINGNGKAHIFSVHATRVKRDIAIYA